MNCEIALPESLLKGAKRRPHFAILGHGKAGILRNQALNFLEIIHLIGRDLDAALRNERSMNCREKIGCHDTPAPMPPFRPRIRKEEMEHIHRCRRQEMLHGVETLHSQNASVCHPAAPDAAARPTHPTREPFDPEKVVFPIRNGAGDEK